MKKDQIPTSLESKSTQTEDNGPVEEQKPQGMPDFDFDFDFGEEDEEMPTTTERRYETQRTPTLDDPEQKPYFHHMYEKVTKDITPSSTAIDTKKVMQELKNHHSESRTTKEALGHTHILQDSIQDTLAELHKHEEEWKELHDLQHEISQKIADKEKAIEDELEKFKSLIRKLTYTKLAPEENAFILSDGQKIRSVSQLITILPTISDETFFSHIQNGRNDFAQWINAIFQDPVLSDVASKCTTRKDLYVALKKAINAQQNA